MSVWGIIFGTIIVALGISVSLVSAINSDLHLLMIGVAVVVLGGFTVGASLFV